MGAEKIRDHEEPIVHSYDDDPWPGGGGGAGDPAPAQAGGAGEGSWPGPLAAVAGAFRLLVAGPQPLALHPGRLAEGLPGRLVPLDELTVLLLHPSVSPAARNTIWAELIRRARSGSPAWTVGLTGVALPGLTRATATVAAGYRGDSRDLEAEVLAGFLAAVRRLDISGLDRVPLASHLMWAAFRAGRALACSEGAWAARRRDLEESAAFPLPARTCGHPDFVLAAAVRHGVITAADADLIGASRLEGIPLSRIAAGTGARHDSLCRRRARAEKRLTRALLAGDIEFPGIT
jgi:hypothetical protein